MLRHIQPYHLLALATLTPQPNELLIFYLAVSTLNVSTPSPRTIVIAYQRLIEYTLAARCLNSAPKLSFRNVHQRRICIALTTSCYSAHQQQTQVDAL
jgi:hypothetical protein